MLTTIVVRRARYDGFALLALMEQYQGRSRQMRENSRCYRGRPEGAALPRRNGGCNGV